MINRGLQRRYRMGRTVMLGGQAKEESEQDEANRPFLLRRQDKDLATNLSGSGALHFRRGLTCRDRYLPRIFS